MNTRILYLTDNHLLAYQVNKKTLVEVQAFPPDPAGEADFVKYLTKDPKTPVIWLVDTTQEEYQTTHLPHVSGRDRHHLLTRKMRRLFEYTPYTYGVVQEREQKGRGDDKVLFLALNNPALLQPWMNLLTTYKVPLVGVCSVPLLSQRLLKYLVKAPYTLLITHTSARNEQNLDGLRQSFFLNQQLQVSRLIPLNTLAPTEYAEYMINQIIKMQRYLESARLLPVESNEILTVVIFTETLLLKALQQYPTAALENLQLHFIDSHDFAHQIGWRSTNNDTVYWHQLLAYHTAKHSWGLSNHYAQPVETRYFRYRKIRFRLYLSALLLLASAGTVSYNILEQALVIKQQGDDKERQVAQRQTELKQLRTRVPNLPIDIVLMRNVVDLGLHLTSLHLSPRPAWEKLSQVLLRHPNLLIEQLEWGIGATATEIFPPLAAASQSGIDRDNEDATDHNQPPPEGIDTQTTTPPDYFWEGLRVQGKISPFGGNYQNALHLFEDFIGDLRKQPQDFSLVKELVSPYNLRRTLQGKIGDSEKDLTAPYAVEILIKHKYQRDPSS